MNEENERRVGSASRSGLRLLRVLLINNNVLNKSMFALLGSHSDFKLQHKADPDPAAGRAADAIPDVLGHPSDAEESSQQSQIGIGWAAPLPQIIIQASSPHSMLELGA